MKYEIRCPIHGAYVAENIYEKVKEWKDSENKKQNKTILAYKWKLGEETKEKEFHPTIRAICNTPFVVTRLDS